MKLERESSFNYFEMKFETASGCWLLVYRCTTAITAAAAAACQLFDSERIFAVERLHRRGYLLNSVNIIFASMHATTTTGTYRLRCLKWVNRIEKVQIIQFQGSN